MRSVTSVAAVLLCVMCAVGPVAAQSTTVDKATSDKLTKYLHKNRLPMVGAQISNTSSGRQVMLYGFVATDFGKSDAVTKSKRYLKDSTIAVINNIRVNPDLRHLKQPPSDANPSGPMDSGLAPPPRAEWEDTFDNTLHSGGVVPSNDPALKMPPPGGPAPAPPASTW